MSQHSIRLGHYPDNDPYATVSWDVREVAIKTGNTYHFRQKNVEAPREWSDIALAIVAQKYFRGYVDKDGTPGNNRETSVKQLIGRVVDTLADWGGYVDVDGTIVYDKRTEDTDLRSDQVYFQTKEERDNWANDLKYMIVNQMFSFNSPVWFNVGRDSRPQCSACFILRLEDYMTGPRGEEFNLDDHGLLAAQIKEGIIFSRGSGSGINLSRVRSSKEHLSGGGNPTGPLPFARGLDTWAASIKSGGKTRRAAKMLILDVDHPDVLDFIRTKTYEESIAKLLQASGSYGKGMDSEAYLHAFHQNSNLSVRVSDKFMEALANNEPWDFVSRSMHFLDDKPDATSMIGVKGKVLGSMPARDLMLEIAKNAWDCADPGIQFHDTINKWHTCPGDGPIVGSNPCSEYMFLDETSCNLGSFNLRKFFRTPGDLLDTQKIEYFQRAIEIVTIAMDIIVSNSRYPTANIRRESQKYRTLGLGYANLGGMLMGMGIPYNSTDGRMIAAAIMSMISGCAYRRSSILAAEQGPFLGINTPGNADGVVKVIEQHCSATFSLSKSTENTLGHLMATKAFKVWSDILASDAYVGVRNAQVTVLAPTGTIGLMMDCATTGIEPEYNIKKVKNLAGGGQLVLDNPLIEEALRNLMYTPEEIAKCLAAVVETGDLPLEIVSKEHREVFRSATPPVNDPTFYLPWTAHVDMMAANQPFISGAISKTVNLPNSATPEDIYNTYIYAWKSGLKAIAIYRDGSKGTQALYTDADKNKDITPEGQKLIQKLTADLCSAEERLSGLESLLTTHGSSMRRKAPRKVYSRRDKFAIDGIGGYIHIGFYPDGAPCEVFLDITKYGFGLGGFCDSFCTLLSWALQYGVPVEKIVTRFSDLEFKPCGVVEYDESGIKSCRSIIDYIVRKLDLVAKEEKDRMAMYADPKVLSLEPEEVEAEPDKTPPPSARLSGLFCRRCGSSKVQILGKCTKCHDCHDESGGCFQ